MSTTRSRSGPAARATKQGPNTREEIMKAQDDLTTALRAEVQLNIQTVREEHLRDIYPLREGHQQSEEKAQLAAQDDLDALRTDHLNSLEELRRVFEALSARVQGMEGELLQVHHDVNDRRNGESALRTRVDEIQDARTGIIQEMGLCFRRVANQIDRIGP